LHQQRCCDEWKTLLGGGDEPESIDQVTSEVVMPNHHREEEDIAEVEVNPRNPNPPRLSWNTAVYQWPNRRGRGWRAISFLFCFFLNKHLMNKSD
jgi:hypothetical protein